MTHYHGAWAKVLHDRTERISVLDNRTIRFDFKAPFLDLPLERAVYQKRQQGGMKEWPGVNILLTGARIGASWANWYESEIKCGGMLAADKFCVTELDAKYDKYLAFDKPEERKALSEEIQREILENYYFVPVFRHAFMNAIGPRIKATKWQEVFPSYKSTGYAYPWEDIELKG
jgi:ABC-type transport system substrate-binding protein